MIRSILLGASLLTLCLTHVAAEETRSRSGETVRVEDDRSREAGLESIADEAAEAGEDMPASDPVMRSAEEVEAAEDQDGCSGVTDALSFDCN